MSAVEVAFDSIPNSSCAYAKFGPLPGPGIMSGAVGGALEWSGFDGEASVQSELVNTTMIVLMGGFPLVCYLVGAALFLRFDLSEAEHARIRAELDARSAAATT